MIANTKFQKEIDLNSGTPVLYHLPKDSDIQIDQLQLEMNCGFNMFGKQIHITICGEKQVKLPVITLSQMYQLLIDLRSFIPNEKGWYVTHLIIKPCQKINYPISVGLNLITGRTSHPDSGI